MSTVCRRTLMPGVLRVTVSLLTAIASPAIADEAGVTMDQVIEQWRLREERAQNLHIEWTETIAIPAESRADQDPLTGKIITLPAKDISIRVSNSLWLSGAMARYDTECDPWDEAYTPFVPRYLSSASNGKYATDFNKKNAAHSEIAFPVGFVDDQSIVHSLRSIPKMPVTLLWRSGILSQLKILDIETFRIIDTSLAGQQGVITISNRDSRAQGVSEGVYYDIDLAVDEAFVPVEVRSYSHDGLSYTVSTTYFNGSDQVRLPNGWHIEIYGKMLNPEENETAHRVTRVIDATIQTCDLNPVVSEDLFEIRFPPGTRVLNRITEEDYILRPDGSKRLITREECVPGVTYQMLVDTESGKAVAGIAAAEPFASASPQTRSRVLYINGFGLLCLAVYLLLRRNRLRSN